MFLFFKPKLHIFRVSTTKHCVQVNSASEESFQAASAFSPLAMGCSPFHRSFNPHANRRFLSAPYAGTGYLPTVIRPPLGYPQNALAMHHLAPSSVSNDIYGNNSCISDKPVTTSPGSASSSEKTTYSE